MSRRAIFVSLAFVVAAGFSYALYSVHRTVTVIVPNAYAVEWASEFVIEHLKANDDEWPTSWGDLRDEYDDAIDRGHTPAVTWEELKDRVEIDWRANVRALQQADGSDDPPFRVIWLSDGSQTHWVGFEPNRRILDYFQGNHDGAALPYSRTVP